ncbi:hypothetical protein AVEN_231794-1 [Araneus ventricosus]|uniref:Uncharacterized protein n=1 Tax=Araneus ventricosus TaxID=182803 RepID=A0A4Y2QTD9_ARAVE|nr:hypothetical protein AVEN_231794-1 [Araneus ventricosus]
MSCLRICHLCILSLQRHAHYKSSIRSLRWKNSQIPDSRKSLTKTAYLSPFTTEIKISLPFSDSQKDIFFRPQSNGQSVLAGLVTENLLEEATLSLLRCLASHTWPLIGVELFSICRSSCVKSSKSIFCG